MKIFDINKINEGLGMRDVFDSGDVICIRRDLVCGQSYDNCGCVFTERMDYLKGQEKGIIDIAYDFIFIESNCKTYRDWWAISYSMIDWKKTIEANLNNKSQIETDIHLDETLSPIHVVDVLEDVLTLDFYDTFENTEAKKLIETCIKALKKGE